MCENYRLDDVVILNDNFRKFLKMRSTEIKYNILINYMLCNYFDDMFDDVHGEDKITFYIRNELEVFLRKNNKYYGDTYSMEGVQKLINNFIKLKTIRITI